MRVKNRGNPIYHRGPQGYDTKRVFKPMVIGRWEGNFNITTKDGLKISFSAHTFEQARRRATNIEKPVGVEVSEYPSIPPSQIMKLAQFCDEATERRNARYVDDKRPYGSGPLNLLLEIAQRIAEVHSSMVSAYASLTPDEIYAIKYAAYENQKKYRGHDYQLMSVDEAVGMQKVKFSSRTSSGYPIIISFMNSNPNVVIVNTVYQEGDAMPINTIVIE
jgi:hypothetical protein